MTSTFRFTKKSLKAAPISKTIASYHDSVTRGLTKIESNNASSIIGALRTSMDKATRAMLEAVGYGD